MPGKYDLSEFAIGSDTTPTEAPTATPGVAVIPETKVTAKRPSGTTPKYDLSEFSLPGEQPPKEEELPKSLENLKGTAWESLYKKVKGTPWEGIMAMAYANPAIRTGEKLGESGVSLLKNMFDSVVKGVPAIASQGLEDPMRATRNVTAGIGAGIPIDIAQTALNLPSYIASINSKKAGDFLNKYTPEIPKKKIQDWMVGSGTPQDVDVRNLAETLPIGVHGVKTGIGAARKAFPNTAPLESQLEGATQAHEVAQEANQTAKAESQRLTGQANPNLMENKIADHNQKIAEINENLKKEPPLEPGKQLLETPEQANVRLQNSRINERRANDVVQNVDTDLRQNLEHGADHHVEAARLLRPALERNRQEGTDLYNELEQDVEGQHINIRNPARERELSQRLLDMIQQRAMDTPEYRNVSNELARLAAGEVIPAHRYISAYKAVNGYMREAYRRAYEVGINEDVRNQWLERAEESQAELNRMREVLRTGIGDENFEKFTEASDYWRKNVIPLYREPLYWRIMDASKSKLGKDLSESLAGEVPGGGLEIINRLARSDPRILKHIVGERYEKNANNVFNPDRRTQSYLNLMPDTQQLIQARNAAQETATQAAQRSALHEDFKKESEKINKAAQPKIKQRQDWEKQKADLEKEVADAQEQIPKLRAASEGEKLSLKQKLAAKHALKRAQMTIDKKVRKLKVLGGLLAIPVIGTTGYQTLKKVLSLTTGE